MSTTTQTTASEAGSCSSWPSTLYSILLSAPPSLISSDLGKPGDTTINININPRRKNHPPGMIWKRTLGQCVHHDLSQEETHGSLVYRQRRRFARVESLGLSGVVFYEIPTKEAGFTLKTIFGDPADKSVRGMTIDGLLDGVGARVVYFPSYACTSFVTGQAISAFFQQQPRLRPVPAAHGFSVDARAFIDSSFTVNRNFAPDLLRSCTPGRTSPAVKTQTHRKAASSSTLPTTIKNRSESLYYHLSRKEKSGQSKASDPIMLHCNKPLVTPGSSTLSLALKGHNPACDTSLPKLESPRPAASHKKAPPLSDIKGYLKETKAAKRRRHNMNALSLSTISDSKSIEKRDDQASNRRIYPTSMTPTALLNPTRVLQDKGQTPRQHQSSIRTSSKHNHPPLRLAEGKENIPPTPMKPQRRRS